VDIAYIGGIALFWACMAGMVVGFKKLNTPKGGQA